MEELAKSILEEMDKLCMEYYYIKRADTIEDACKLAPKIQEMASVILSFNSKEQDILELKKYVIEIINDYTEAMRYKDSVYMIDTLDFGLREVLRIFVDDKRETGADE